MFARRLPLGWAVALGDVVMSQVPRFLHGYGCGVFRAGDR
jgi:hypothetical protein